jgi:glycosyltransferase involved in cell wall biosynthesis
MAAAASSIQRLRRMIVERRIDMIHANNFKMHILAALASAGRRTPVLWHVRDIFPERSVSLLRLASRAATRVLTVSRAVAAQFANQANVSVLYNAVELPPKTVEPQAIAPRVIGYVGRLDSGKGIDILVRAFLSLAPRHPQIRLLIAGEGPERRSIPSHPAIEVAGFQSDVSSAWSRIDVCVQPSSQPDSFPRSVIEAMSWSKPVVASAIGGIPEAIEEGATGLLFRPGEANGLEAKLETLLRHPTRAQAMGAAGRRRCEALFSVPAHVAQLTKIYETTYALCHS